MAVATPTISIIVETDHLSVSFDNTGGASLNYLKRNGIYIGKTIPDDSPDPDLAVFNDYQTRSGQQVSYQGVAFGGGQESAPTAPITATLTLAFATIHQVAKGTNGNIDANLPLIELFNLEGQSETRSRETSKLRLAAVEKPRIKSAPQVARVVECPIIVRRQDRATVIPLLEQMLWSDELFCFRDPLGELIFGTLGNQETKTDLNMEMVLTITESAYSEAV